MQKLNNSDTNYVLTSSCDEDGNAFDFRAVIEIQVI